MASFLQAILAGYGGLRYQVDHLSLNPSLPPGVTDLYYAGLDYLGSSLDISVREDTVLVRLMTQKHGSPSLTLYVLDPQQVHKLSVGTHVSITRTQAVIMASHLKFPSKTP